MRLLLGRDQRQAEADVHDALDQPTSRQPITVEPMRRLPDHQDLVTDVSWNYEVKKRIPVQAPPARRPDGTWRMQQATSTACRSSASASSASCARTSATCCATTTSTSSSARASWSHRRARDAPARRPRTRLPQGPHGIGYCNITKCCTEVCPEHITITDNAIIPLKERVVDRYYDPLWGWWGRSAERGGGGWGGGGVGLC